MASSAGRPLDPRVTAALVDATLDLLSETGIDGVNADAISQRAGAGKAALYRRWSSVPGLIHQAVGSCTLIPSVSTTGVLLEDLTQLLAPWTRPLNRDERAAAALLGHARHRPELRDALHSALVGPLSTIVQQILDHEGSGRPCRTEDRHGLLDLVVRALWWNRYAGCSQVLTAAQLTSLIDQVLMPITRQP